MLPLTRKLHNLLQYSIQVSFTKSNNSEHQKLIKKAQYQGIKKLMQYMWSFYNECTMAKSTDCSTSTFIPTNKVLISITLVYNTWKTFNNPKINNESDE